MVGPMLQLVDSDPAVVRGKEPGLTKQLEIEPLSSQVFFCLRI